MPKYDKHQEGAMWRVDVCLILFMVMCFIIGYVNWMCQSFLSGCVFLFFSFSHSFWARRYGFLTYPCLWEMGFSSQMIMEPSVCYWTYIGSSSDHIFILLVTHWNWRELGFGGGLYRVLYNIFI